MCGSSALKSYGSGGSSNGIGYSFRCPADHRIPALSQRRRLELPPVVLGCGNFGGIGSAPAFFGRGETKEEAFVLMDAAWALGLDWIDTADAYGGGRSERWIGEWIASSGNRPRITTKTFNPMDEGADSGLGRARVLRQLDSSLERLRVDAVDLYLAHEPDPETPFEETVRAFEELAAAGKVRAHGGRHRRPAPRPSRRAVVRVRAAEAAPSRARTRGAPARALAGRARGSSLAVHVTPLLVVWEADVVELLDMEGCIGAMEQALAALDRGEVTFP